LLKPWVFPTPLSWITYRNRLVYNFFIHAWSRTSWQPVCDGSGWKYAESYYPSSRLTRTINYKDLWLGPRVGSLWNVTILWNGAYREMMSLKKWSNKSRPKNSCWPLFEK
jgi:hypothetical protein